MAELVEKKVIISGDVIEFYDYGNPYLKGFEQKKKTGSKGRKKDFRSDEYRENRKRTLHRASADLRRTINANVNAYGKDFAAKFITLTFEENIQDLDYAHNEFMKFIKRLNYYIFKTKIANVKYSAVVEFQKRGAVHYHVVFYNLPYIPASKINDLWRRSNGNINVKRIKHVDNIGSYVCKYMSKENEDERLEGRKCYFNSRGLFKPTEITDKKRVEALLQALPLIHLKYRNQFENEYLGVTQYCQFNIKYNNPAIPSSSWTFKNVSS